MKTLFPFLILSFYLSGCATLWSPNITTMNQSVSEVILSKANFKVVKFISESYETKLFLGLGSKRTLVSQVRAKMFANATRVCCTEYDFSLVSRCACRKYEMLLKY